MTPANPMALPETGLHVKQATSNAKQRFIVNVASNAGFVVLNTGLMLWYIPFLIRHLGVAAYGMIPLANMLVMYTGIIAGSLDITINRFLAIDINQDNIAAANRTFNTALTLSLVVMGLMLVPIATLIFLFPTIFNTPAGLEHQAQLLFACVAINSLITMLSANFGVSSLILHRFDLRNLVRSMVTLSRSGIVVILFMMLPAQLWHVATGFIVSALIGLCGDMLVWHRLTPQLHINPQLFDRVRWREMLGLGSWSVLNQAGMMLLMQIDLLVVNAFFGVEMTGRYGTILLFPTLITTLGETISSVLSPAITAQYARQDFAGMLRTVTQAVKLLSLILALPVGLVCGFSRPLLTIWLGSDFQGMAPLLVILVGHLSITLATRPLSYLITAYNKMRSQALWTVISGITNIGLALGLALWTPLGVMGVALSLAIVWLMKNLIILAIYSAHIMSLPRLTFFRPLILGALATFGVGLTSWLISTIWTPTSWLSLGILGIAVCILYAILTYAFGLSHNERQLIWNIVTINWRTPLLSLYERRVSRSVVPDHINQLNRYYSKPMDERVSIQRARLVQLLLHAAQHVPYYHDILTTAGVFRNGQIDLTKFQHVPCLTRDILITYFETLKSDDLSQREWHKNMSGGSTGTPVVFIQDRAYRELNDAMKTMYYGWVGKKEGEAHITLWGSDRDIVKNSYSRRMRLSNFVRNRILLNSFRMTPKNRDQYITTIRSTRPALIEAYADSAYDLAHYANMHGLSIEGARAMITSAGPLHPFMREEIAQAFRCPVFNRYGSREVGDMAAERQPGGDLQVFTYTHMIEVLNEQGDPCCVGEEGDIYVTCLSNYAMPFIRYRIGDRAVVGLTTDNELSSVLSLKAIAGREIDRLIREDGSSITGVFFSHFLGVIHNKGLIRKSQLIQQDYHSFLIKLVVSEQPAPELLASIRDSVQQVMGRDSTVEFEYVDDIPPLPSGKHRYVISHVQQPAPEPVVK